LRILTVDNLEDSFLPCFIFYIPSCCNLFIFFKSQPAYVISASSFHLNLGDSVLRNLCSFQDRGRKGWLLFQSTALSRRVSPARGKGTGEREGDSGAVTSFSGCLCVFH
jgi:hypothetical protein